MTNDRLMAVLEEQELIMSYVTYYSKSFKVVGEVSQ